MYLIMRLRDSQHDLAESIARAVQAGLPLANVRQEISGAVRSALQREARASEVMLARGRVFGVSAYVCFCAAATLWPQLLGLSGYPLSNLFFAILWLGASVLLLLVLRSGEYHRAFRRGIPFVDTLFVTTAVLLIHGTLPQTGATPVGIAMTAAIACALIAFAGSLRLSRTAVRFSTGAGVLGVIVVARFAHLHLLELFFLSASVLAAGLLGSRLTRIIRRLITKEIAGIELQRLYEDARDVAAAREEVLQIVSHDLRNPLHTIGMAADLIEELAGTAENLSTVGVIKRSTQRMNRLIQDLLDVAKLETGRLAIDPEAVKPDTLVSDATEELGGLVQQARLELVVDIGADLPAVSADRGRVLQVFSNLVGNAVKFTPAGGTITLGARSQPEMIQFFVRDTGPGIPADQVHRIFGRFWQARRSDRRGLGLGLTIAKSIVEAQGGQIGVVSTIGVGTTFWFTVPLASASEQPRAAHAASEEPR